MEMKVENGVLTITAPLSQGVPSQSGKTLVIATTSGFKDVPDSPGIKVSLNVTKPRS